MYIINEVSEVNKKFIFFHFSDGTQDRKAVNMAELESLYIDVSEKMKYLKFTVNYNHKYYCELNAEYEKQEKIIECYEICMEEHKEGHKEEPLIRRGLHEICFAFTTAEKERYKIGLQLSGVSRAMEKADNEYWKLYKLQKQIENVL